MAVCWALFVSLGLCITCSLVCGLDCLVVDDGCVLLFVVSLCLRVCCRLFVTFIVGGCVFVVFGCLGLVFVC